jgi:hypothetical protein
MAGWMSAVVNFFSLEAAFWTAYSLLGVLSSDYPLNFDSDFD